MATETSISTGICDKPLEAILLASGGRFSCVEYAVTDKDIQRKVLHYISGKDIFGVELQSAEEKIDTTV